MMFAFLKRLVGTSDEYRAAEKRYKKQLEELTKREEELDALGEQLHGVSALQKEKSAELSKTSTELSRMLVRSLSSPRLKVTRGDDDEDEEGPSPREIISSLG